MLPSHRNQSIDLHSKSVTGFYMRATLAFNALSLHYEKKIFRECFSKNSYIQIKNEVPPCKAAMQKIHGNFFRLPLLCHHNMNASISCKYFNWIPNCNVNIAVYMTILNILNIKRADKCLAIVLAMFFYRQHIYFRMIITLRYSI